MEDAISDDLASGMARVDRIPAVLVSKRSRARKQITVRLEATTSDKSDVPPGQHARALLRRGARVLRECSVPFSSLLGSVLLPPAYRNAKIMLVTALTAAKNAPMRQDRTVNSRSVPGRVYPTWSANSRGEPLRSAAIMMVQYK